jgi:hypothetical protein
MALIPVNNKSKVGGKALTMPQFVTADNNIYLKTSNNAFYESNNGAFYGALQQNFNDFPFEIATFQQAASTSEQTIIDTGSGKQGVLTQVICAGLSSAGTSTIRVTTDGVTHVFSRYLPTATRLFSIGDFLTYRPAISTNQSTGPSSGLSFGFSLSFQLLTMMPPTYSASKGLPIGMVFHDSLKVTIQGSVNFTAGGSNNKSVAAYLDYIPKGVI